MSTELEQLAAEHAPKFVTSAYSLGVEEVTPLLKAFAAEVQRQTIEACARKCDAGAEICANYPRCHQIDAAEIRSLLSLSQEVKHG